MEEVTNVVAKSNISQNDVDDYAHRRYAKRALHIVLATLLSLFVFAPLTTIPLVKYKKKVIVFPILFVILTVLTIIMFSNNDIRGVLDNLYLAYLLVLNNVVSVICLGMLASDKEKNKYIIDVEREVLAGEGKAAKNAFTAELARLSKAHDYDGFVSAVDGAHGRYEAKQNAVLAQAEANGRAQAFVPECDGKSTFDGTLLQCVGWTMLCNIVNAVTLGIAYPATLCWKMRWQASHTLYNGKRLSFDGNGIQLLGKWICWGLLTIITLGIYGFFVAGKIEAWKAKHTHVAGECAELGGTFDGNPFALVGYNILCGFLSTISFGLAVPAAMCIKERWLCKHRVYDGRRLSFDGTGAVLFGKYIKWFLLSIVTLGVYSLWIPNKLLKWKAEHTALSDEVEHWI